jgi:hypothetical protein
VKNGGERGEKLGGNGVRLTKNVCVCVCVCARACVQCACAQIQGRKK